LLIDAQSSERECDAAGHRVGLERRSVDRVGPVGLVDRKPARTPPVLDIRIEFDAGLDGRVVVVISEFDAIRVIKLLINSFQGPAMVRACLDEGSEIVRLCKIQQDGVLVLLGWEPSSPIIIISKINFYIIVHLSSQSNPAFRN
jgi:hypothetical protein